jgi:DNA-binding beta-propeller fold protein YncE
MKSITVVSGILVLLFAASIGAQTKSGYHLVDTIKVGGEGGWDILTADGDNHRLYVSHGTHVVVIDTNTDKVVGDIPNTNGVHGIAVASKLGRGFTSNGRDDTVTIFDLKTLKILGTVKTDKNPDAIIFDAATKRVFCFNGGSNDATVIDAEKGTVVGTVALGGKPEFAVSDMKGTIFVNLEDKSQVAAFDARTLAVKSHWPFALCEEPSGLAIDTKNKRLFAACSNKQMAIMDSQTGKVIGSVPTGQGADGAEFDPATRFAFSPNGEGTLSVIHEDTKDKFSLVENVTTQPRARTMALDTRTHKIYMPSAQFGPAPAPTKEHPRPRAPMLPGSFVVLVYGR